MQDIGWVGRTNVQISTATTIISKKGEKNANSEQA